MKKNIITIITIVLVFIFSMCFLNTANANNTRTSAINEKTESQLVELKDRELKSMEDYEEAYGSKTYGLTAYILNKVRLFSIPLCFLGILIGAILDYVIGTRHLENKEKGLALMISFVTIAIICQVLPLVFTIVVKFGRE